MKKILSLFLAFILVLSVAMPVSAGSSTTKLYNDAGNILKDLGVLQGFSDGSLGLDGELLREQLVVMISRLYGEEERAKNFEAPNIFTDLKPEHKFYVPYIKWAVDKGLVSGYPNKTFRPKNKTTVQEYQKVLLTALGYNIGSEDWNMVPALSESYGLMKDLKLNSSATLTRGQMAVMSLNTLDQEMNGKNISLGDHLNLDIPKPLKIKSSHKVENNTLIVEGEVSGANDKGISLNLTSSNLGLYTPYPIEIDESGKFTKEISNLEVGDYQYRFQSDTQYTDYNSFTIDVLPFTFPTIKADNLKEIHLSFTQPVNKALASLVSNYNTTAGTIKDIGFEDGDKKIILTLNAQMINNRKYKISALSIKSMAGEEIIIDNHEFQAFDNQAPQVLEIKQVGTKGIKIYFSEPIKKASSSNFKVDGINFPGNLTFNNNIVSFTYFTTNHALKEGEHSLTVSGIEDYANNRIVQVDIPFAISKDTSPPSVESFSASMDEVIIEFNEEINPTSAARTNFYWKSNTKKMHPDRVSFDENIATLSFKNNPLSINGNTIFVENIRDYSDNILKSASFDVVPVIDNSNPEVLKYDVSKDGKSISVFYSKNVLANAREYYSIFDQNNKSISIKSISGGDAKYTINLYTPLAEGSNTFSIENVLDTTPYKNKLVPFTTKIEMKDIEKPNIVSYNGYANNIIITFTKIMNIDTIINPSNYIMTFKGKQERMPIDTQFIPNNDGTAVTITLPSQIDNIDVMIGMVNNLTNLNVIGLKDSSGNDTDPLMINIAFDVNTSGKAKPIDYYSDRGGRQGVLLESNLIKVKFNVPIVYASPNDFSIAGRNIYDVIADGTDVISIFLDDDNSTSLPSKSLKILASNYIQSSIDARVEETTVLLLDKVPPRIKSLDNNLNVNGNKIELPFTEALQEEGVKLYNRDLEVIRLADGKILSEFEFTTDLFHPDKSILTISIDSRVLSSGYSIRLRGQGNQEELSYIRDKDGNPALPSDLYFTSKPVK